MKRQAVANIEANKDVWLPAIVARVASFLPGNFVDCTLRLLDKATSVQLSDMRTVQLSQPAPRVAFAERWLAPGACRSLALKQRQQLVCLVAASGDVANLEIAIQAAGCPLPVEEALGAAAGAGALESCQHLAGLLQPSDGALGLPIISAAKGGHRNVCEWCLGQGAVPSWRAVAAAYSGGHTELAELLRPEAGEPGLDDQVTVLEGAAEGCSLAALKGLWAQWGGEVLRLRSTALAAALGSPTPDWEAKAEFLLARGFTFDPLSARHAVRLPPDTALQRLEWMRGRGWVPDAWSLRNAISAGSLEGVKWNLDAGVRDEHSNYVIVAAALMAGSKGLPILRWLVETEGAGALQAIWTSVCDFAARAGCVEMMEYAMEHGGAYGVTFSESSWGHVARSGCEAALEWLDQRGCPKPANGECYEEAAHNNDIRTLRVLRRLGLPWAKSTAEYDAFASAVRSGSYGNSADVSTLRWLLAEGCPVDWAAAREAAERRLRQQDDPNEATDDPWAAEVLAWVEEQAAAASTQPGVA